MPRSLEETKHKVTKFVTNNKKAVILFILAALLAPPGLWNLYQEHENKQEESSLIETSLTKADSLHDAGEYEEAVMLYEETIKKIPSIKFPSEYGRAQNNLGNAYQNLADVRDKEANLEKAVYAYLEALKIRTIESYPLDYAITQNDLQVLLDRALVFH
jgi:tetratricopeptide (TPR) repeat protein